MNYLVDTHIFLWSVFSSKKLPPKIKSVLLDLEKTIHVSLITFWEITLKYQLGKIDLTGILPDKLPVVAKRSGFEILNLNVETASSFYKLPKLKNKDPFDRMLVWQAISNNLYLISRDEEIAEYRKQGLKVVW